MVWISPSKTVSKPFGAPPLFVALVASAGAKDLIVALAALPIVVLAATRVGYPAIQSVRPTFDPAMPTMAFAPAALMLVFAVLAEDTLYRGYAFHQLSRRLGRPLAVALTSLAYALIAPGQGWPLVIFAFLLGITLCLVRLLTGSLAPVVLVHAATALTPKGMALIND